MTSYIIWQRANRGPTIAVMHGYDAMNESERRTVLAGPFAIFERDEGLGIDVLARLYPLDGVRAKIPRSAEPT